MEGERSSRDKKNVIRLLLDSLFSAKINQKYIDRFYSQCI